jgi:hypothetical protein
LDRTIERHIKSNSDDRMLDLCFFSQTREAIRAAPEGRRGLAVAKSRHRPVGKPDIAGLWLSVECDGLINDPLAFFDRRWINGGRFKLADM